MMTLAEAMMLADAPAMKVEIERLRAENVRMRQILRILALHNPDKSFENWRLVIQCIEGAENASERGCQEASRPADREDGGSEGSQTRG